MLAPLCAAALLLGAWPSGAAASKAPGGQSSAGRGSAGRGSAGRGSVGRGSVVLAFLPASTTLPPSSHGTPAGSEGDAFEGTLANVSGMSVGIMSATQGSYSATQLLLDITQGARIASSSYSPAHPPVLRLRAVGAGAVVEGWQVALERAEGAPQLLRPGLLAAQVPGGAAYAGITGTDDLDGVAAADRSGHIAAVSTGSARTLPERIAALRKSRRLVVADLPYGSDGRADLSALSTGREAGELLLVLQRTRAARGHELLWAAAAGLPGGDGKALTSQTTNQRGLIAAVDIAPTILHELGLTPIPADMRGQQLRPDGALRSAGLPALMARLHVIGGRRLKALGCLLGAWALLLLASVPWPARGAPGASNARAAGTPARTSGPARTRRRGSARSRAWAMRTGALGVLWAPSAVLITAALAPSAALEYATIALACLALGALTDLLLPWPRAPLAPALVSVVVLSADALAGTQLLMRSLLGPNPILGARFYGIGNELKSGLAVLVLAAVAAAQCPGTHGRRTSIALLTLAGVVLAAVEGSARIGAGVGGVILVAAGFAMAIVMLLPGAMTRKRILSVLIAPVLALVALAALDLATAHGSGHFTGSILHARSAGDLRDVIVRRYGAAWGELKNHAMPVATAFALLYAGLGLRWRDRLLAPVAGDPMWRAAFAGGLAAGVVGALAEDSGPVLLVVAVFTLGCVATYLWGRPPQQT